MRRCDRAVAPQVSNRLRHRGHHLFEQSVLPERDGGTVQGVLEAERVQLLRGRDALLDEFSRAFSARGGGAGARGFSDGRGEFREPRVLQRGDGPDAVTGLRRAPEQLQPLDFRVGVEPPVGAGAARLHGSVAFLPDTNRVRGQPRAPGHALDGMMCLRHCRNS